MENSTQILISMCIYMLAVIGIGVYYAKRANRNSDAYFLGDRSLGPWVAAMSAEASDMSGWLLMGLPGVAYWCGLSDALWTAIGLAVGTYCNWLLVAKRLRKYSQVVDAVTLPDFFSNRFREKKKVIMIIASLFILIFFTVYASSTLVTCGKLFSTLFGADYVAMLVLGAFFVVTYTLLGGFLAESASDFMQAVVMIVALATITICSTVAVGGIGQVVENVSEFPGFLEFFGIASPVTDAAGVQAVSGGAPSFGPAGDYGFLTVISTLAWGLGYFGMPQVLLRFMAIRRSSELPRARRVGTIWCVISLAAAIFIGIAGRALYPTEPTLLTSGGSESVFIVLSTRLLPPLLAGFVMAGILAATISSSDSYLLIAASALSKNLVKGVFRKNASEKQVMWISRITLCLLAIVGVMIGLDPDSVIFQIVSFAWAGFGATFGPLMLFSLFWKRTTRAGAIAGMLSGGGMVFVWKLLIKPLGGAFGIYELLPAFVLSCIVIVVTSLLTQKPSAQLEEDFEAAKALTD